MKLSPHFTLDEFLHSDFATRNGIANIPGADAMDALHRTADGMERVREILDCPIHISSGFRSHDINLAIGGAEASQHVLGEAADFTAPEFGAPIDVCRAIYAYTDRINYDQLIYEGSWVHISFRDKPRRQVLTAKFYRGKARYTLGLEE